MAIEDCKQHQDLSPCSDPTPFCFDRYPIELTLLLQSTNWVSAGMLLLLSEVVGLKYYHFL